MNSNQTAENRADFEALAAENRELTERLRQITEELKATYAAARRDREILQRELAVARRVQQTIIPSGFDRERLSVGVGYVPISGIGGDLGLARERDAAHYDVAIGDVTGHGIAAALVGNRVHTVLGELYAHGAPIDAVLHRLDFFLAEEIADIGIFMTYLACRFDLEKMEMEYAGGGHPEALHYRSGTGEALALAAGCGILGTGQIYCDNPPVKTAKLQSGDFVILYTDGLIDAAAPSGEAFGRSRLQETVARAAAQRGGEEGNLSEKIADKLVEEAKRFTGGAFQDDVLVVAVHIK